jgi:transposase
MNKDSTKTRTVNFHQLPPKLWKKLKKHLPKGRKRTGPGRPRVQNRDVINGIWYDLWSGCQWKAVKKEWFHVSSSTLHERFQTWQQKGVFDKLFKVMVNYYAREMKIGWKW